MQPKLKEEIRSVYEAADLESAKAAKDRLMGALLMEQDEKWSTGRKYFDMDVYHQENQPEETSEKDAA